MSILKFSKNPQSPIKSFTETRIKVSFTRFVVKSRNILFYGFKIFNSDKLLLKFVLLGWGCPLECFELLPRFLINLCKSLPGKLLILTISQHYLKLISCTGSFLRPDKVYSSKKLSSFPEVVFLLISVLLFVYLFYFLAGVRCRYGWSLGLIYFFCCIAVGGESEWAQWAHNCS